MDREGATYQADPVPCLQHYVSPSPLWSNGVSLQQSHGVLPGSPHHSLLQPHGGDYQLKPLQVWEQDMLDSWQPFCTLHDGCHQSMHHGLQFRARWTEDNLRCFHYKLHTKHLRTCEGKEKRRGVGECMQWYEGGGRECQVGEGCGDAGVTHRLGDKH